MWLWSWTAGGNSLSNLHKPFRKDFRIPERERFAGYLKLWASTKMGVTGMTQTPNKEQNSFL
ncbi:MAG TPA: hypothetical protein DCS07_17145 [Bdellovibrionales bacterium]|nr:MAG: hypothetical protein A2Z97_13655 [Bdellovibrionales bacterium GWB1_52_6]OFZ06056.1 MAG: hypothetical protein A2X97_01835 [Bdellovibrionales bacterium GWA1_52_35]OFZ34362.1 MAG: hypothetical protein A2070_14875 [Bdellovibrionales bacterium GWC1_52_8]HAR44328.1 hypothetical protein [Bdellovibrionales bacterium]